MKDLITIAVKPIKELNIDTYQGYCIYNEYCPILNKTLVSNTPTNFNVIPYIFIIIIGVVCVSLFIHKYNNSNKKWIKA